MPKLELQVYPKINLCLEVMRRDRSGYHKIDTVIQEIGNKDLNFKTLNSILSDQIQVKLLLESTEDRIALDTDYSIGEDTRTEIFNAIQNFMNKFRADKLGFMDGFYQINLQKQIPVGAGLGGGSADMAALLKYAFNDQSTKKNIDNYGANFGKDIPFFLHGGLCRATGYGDKIEELLDLPEMDIFILYPKFKISTKWAYKKLNSKKKKPEYIQNILFCIESKAYKDLPKVIHNDFEPLILDKYPLLAKMKKDLAISNVHCNLTGSGSAFFGFSDQEVEDRLISLVDQNQFSLYFTKTRPRNAHQSNRKIFDSL